jgi:hypothetical protein
MAYVFGTGLLALRPSGTNPTPVQVGVLKDVSVDASFTTKELRGAYQFPLDIARAGGKLSVKAKSGTLAGGVINSLLTGSTMTTGSVQGVQGESATIPSTPFEITVTNGATFKTDFGVFDKTSGKWMTRGATATATGVYAVNETTGKYTFNTGDTGHALTIYYSWTDATNGKTISLTNQLMGSGATFQLHLFNSFRSKSQGITLWAVTSTKLSMAFKSEDYMEKDLDFEAFQDAAGNVVDLYTAD